MDRTLIILDIFCEASVYKEGKIQVELACSNTEHPSLPDKEEPYQD